MRQFGALILREWIEWRRAIVVLFLVFFGVGILMLVPIGRATSAIDTQVDIFVENGSKADSLEITFFGETDWVHSPDDPTKLFTNSKGNVYQLMSGIFVGIFSSINGMLFLVLLFYFADSIFKERDDGSTFFYRSLPMSDHKILLSKWVAAASGLLGLTLVLNVIAWFFAQISMSVVPDFAESAIREMVANIQMLDLFGDMFVLTFVRFLWTIPFFAFLFFVSSVAKRRPLLIGIGSPILLIFAWKILFGEAIMADQSIEYIIQQKTLLVEQWLVETDANGNVEIFGSFWKYIFTTRTVVSLVFGSIFYTLAWLGYRKNIPTS